MKIHLQELPHQRQALDVILNSFPPIEEAKQSPSYANPILQNAHDQRHFLDIKMETGTGKTYVYTRAMYELHKQFGLYKFIIVVPSLAIKAGTENFIKSDYARQHFAKFFPNKKIELQVIGSGDFSSKKGKRKNFPATLLQFCDATKIDRNTIQCLLLCDKGYLDRKDGALFRNDYDQTLFNGLTCPVEALKETLPVLIIDEPHRLKKDGKSYTNIIEKINPQIIIRFGATFPTVKIGKGKKALEKPDFYQDEPQFDLGAVDAFNQDLVKGVSVDIPQLPEGAHKQIYKIKSISKNEVVFSNGVRIRAGESLSALGVGFQGNVTYESDGKLSNDLELQTGMELIEGVFSNSYQELLINLALDAHFKAEIENFHRGGQGYKVKTIALFFIDSIKSYRNEQGWLKTTFEKLLKVKLENLLKEYPSGEYHDFLLETKNDLSLAHGGYFAKDWGEPDESAIADEREDILHKERTLSLKKEDGRWNIRRFFFSKWTLREGWDNPNVFTICKLRTSGSEISKIQEVGRGLRLPVDEQGNRLSGEWRLNFIVGWNEREFANKLVSEINQDAKVILNTQTLTAEMIKIICDNRPLSENSLLSQLDKVEIIHRNNDFQEGGYEKLIAMYPELLQAQLKQGKVTSPTTKEKQKKIKLRTENWQKIKSFWQEVSKRYMLFFERIDRGEMDQLFYQTLKTEGIFDDNKNIDVVIKQTQKTTEEKIIYIEKKLTIANPNLIGKLQYGEFVKKIAIRTALPVQTIHTQ